MLIIEASDSCYCTTVVLGKERERMRTRVLATYKTTATVCTVSVGWDDGVFCDCVTKGAFLCKYLCSDLEIKLSRGIQSKILSSKFCGQEENGL